LHKKKFFGRSGLHDNKLFNKKILPFMPKGYTYLNIFNQWLGVISLSQRYDFVSRFVF